MGLEDATQLTLGFLTDTDGKKSVVNLKAWREKSTVWCKYQKGDISAAIKSESEEVVMKLPLYPGPFSVSATGKAWQLWPSAWGDYTLALELHRDRPVYRRISGGWGYLYSLESGAWAVGEKVGQTQPPLRSTTPAPSPALCQNWEYIHVCSEYKPGDITVSYSYHK